MCSLSQYSDSVSDPICRTTLCRQPLITRTGHWEALTELVDGVRPTPSTGAIGHPCRAGIGELPIETSPKATDVLFVKWRHMVFSRPSLQELPCVRDVNLLASGASAVVEPASTSVLAPPLGSLPIGQLLMSCWSSRFGSFPSDATSVPSVLPSCGRPRWKRNCSANSTHMWSCNCGSTFRSCGFTQFNHLATNIN